MANDMPVALTVTGHTAEIVLNRPASLNAINLDVLVALEQRLEEAEDNRAVRAIIVRGNGRGFCAGADLSFLGDRFAEPDVFGPFLEVWHRVFARISASDLPTIAAVHGYALAGGFELLEVCDLVVVADDAKLGDHHAQLGLFPAGGGTQRLPRLIGRRPAMWLLLSGEWVTPSDALALGLVNAVVPVGELLARARSMAEVLASRSALASAAIKRAVREGCGSPLADGLAVERAVALEHMQSVDVQIGLAAFAGRSTPTFSGR
jgi:enoyl-CoA hydratase/carnithine racemase